MVRPRTGGDWMSVKRTRPHPESYTIRYPQHIMMTPARLTSRWAAVPPGPYEVVTFFDEQPSVAARYIFSNWFESLPFSFTIPEFCGGDWVEEAGLDRVVMSTNGERLLMLCKAALFQDARSFQAILNADTAAEVKRLGRRVSGFLDSLWLGRVCAIVLAVVRCRVANVPGLREQVLASAGRFMAEVAPNDKLHGIGLADGDPRVSEPSAWQGANVLGWAYMTVATEIGGDSRRADRPRPDQPRESRDEDPQGGGSGGSGSGEPGSGGKDGSASADRSLSPAGYRHTSSPVYPDPSVGDADIEEAEAAFAKETAGCGTPSCRECPPQQIFFLCRCQHAIESGGRCRNLGAEWRGGLCAQCADGPPPPYQCNCVCYDCEEELPAPPPSPRASVAVPTKPSDSIAVPAHHCARVSELVAAYVSWAYCIIITTLLEPLVLAHADGDTHLVASIHGEPGSSRGRDDRLLEQAEAACRAVVPLERPLLIPTGMTYPQRAPVVASPVAYVPPAGAVVRTPMQRRKRLAAGASFLFMTMAALSGTPAYQVAAPALARINTFVRPAMGLREATLAGAVLSDAVRFQFGGREVASLVRDTMEPPNGPADAVTHCRRVHEHERALMEALRAVRGDDDISKYQRESAEAVSFLDLDSVPDSLCRPPTERPSDRLATLPFSHDCPVPVTDYVPRQPQQPVSCNSCAASVSSCSEFILPVPRCRGLMDQWWDNATYDFERLRNGLRLEGHRRTRTIALADDCFIPCARGCWFDCRREASHGVSTLDYHQEIGSQLNRQAMREGLRGWPDQALASYVEHGVVYPDLPHILTLGPQLLSLADGFDRAQKELSELVSRGWYALFAHFAFFPFHMCPKGCTERKLEADRPRPTTDGSHPPCYPDGSARVFDSRNQPVYSPNWYARRVPLAQLGSGECEACEVAQPTYCCNCLEAESVTCEDSAEGSSHPNTPTWWSPINQNRQARLATAPPTGWAARTSVRWDEAFWKGYATWGWYGGRTPEFKPTIRTLLRNQLILRTPAYCLDEPIYQTCDDWKNAFNHLRTRPEAWPKSCTLAYSHPHLQEQQEPQLLFTAEYVMGFGHTDNSGVFQRLASYIQHEVMRIMDELEQPRLAALREQNECFDAWANQRLALSATTGRNEFRVYTMLTYSDDPTNSCVGIPCVLNWLEAWRTVNLRFGMLAAIVAKRSLGTQVKWLGALPNPHLGYLTVPQDKLLRVQEMLDHALQGKIPKSNYRSLLGFLEWFAWCFVHPRSRMWGLYAPLRGMDDGTAVMVEPTPRMVEQLTRWKADLWQVSGVLIESALPRRRRNLPSQAATFFVSMDAAKEGTTTPGLAGWCHGWSWVWPYPTTWLQLPIAVHEFLAFAVSVIQFEPFLNTAPAIVFDTDSISTAFNLENENAKSPLMQIAFQLLLSTQQWVTLIVEAGEQERAIRHVKGKINIFADAESRGHNMLVSDLCVQLGIKHRRLPLSKAAVQYLNAFAAAVSPLVPLALQGLDVSPACSAHDGPTLAGFLPIPQEPVQSQRVSSAGRTLWGFVDANEPSLSGPPTGPSAAASQESAAAAPVVMHEDPHWQDRVLLQHLDLAIASSLRDGVIPTHEGLTRLQTVQSELRARSTSLSSQSNIRHSAGSSERPDAGQVALPRHGAASTLRLASDDYALTGMQVATAYAAPHPQQPNARGYPSGSRYSLNPPEQVWSDFLMRRQRALEASFPDSTAAANDCHWKFWNAHCALWGCTTPIRDNHAAMSGRDPLGQRDELDLAASFVDSRYYTMQPRTIGTVPKVESAFQSYLHVVRVQGCRSIPPLPMKELRRLVKGMNNIIIEDLGVEVILPKRKQPVNNALHDQLLRAIPEHTKLGPFVFVRDSHFGRSWRRLLGVLDNSGFRKAEWAARKAGGCAPLVFRQVAYCFDGSEEPLRRPSLSMLQAQHYEIWLYIYPVPSKCDPDGSKFCTKAIPFKCGTDADDVVRLFIDEEIRMWQQEVTDEDRYRTPLFSAAPGVAFHRSAIDAALSTALLLFVPPQVASHISWHSYRVRLACKLKADNCDNPTIQACVRWASDRAVAIYARYERDHYWNLLQGAHRHDATSVQFTALPEIDEMQRVVERLGLTGRPQHEIDACVERLAGASAPAATASAAPASARPTTISSAANVGHVAGSSSQAPAQPTTVSSTTRSVALQPAAVARPRAALPPGWHRSDVRLSSGRVIPTYHGPNGTKARSAVQASRLAGQQSVAAGSPPHEFQEGSPPGASSSPQRQPTVGSARQASVLATDSHAWIGGARCKRSRTDSLGACATTHPTECPQRAAASSHRVLPRITAPESSHPPARLPDYYVPTPGGCGTLGCTLPYGHLGLCTSTVPVARKRPSSYSMLPPHPPRQE